MASWCTGISIITTRAKDGTPYGFTASSLSSLSLEPPQLLFCLGSHVRGKKVFMETETFAVHLLTEKQRDLAELFASDSDNKFPDGCWQKGRLDTPLLEQEDRLYAMECLTTAKLSASGENRIIIGQPKIFYPGTPHAMPLLYFCQKYHRLSSL